MSMRNRAFVVALIVAALTSVRVPVARAASAEVEELKRQVRMLQDRIDQIEKREQTRAAAPPAAVAPAAPAAAAPPVEVVGHPAPVKDRGSLRDEQTAAPRPGDLTLDP